MTALRARLRRWLEPRLTDLWYRRHDRYYLAYLFIPLSLLFACLVESRRLLYRCGILRSYGVAKPVIVIGNFTVGGGGKTLLVLELVRYLREYGLRAGIVMRGYGRGAARMLIVDDGADVVDVGDEAYLLWKRLRCPLLVGGDRVRAARYLAKLADVDVVVADDGLQHYRLQRDIEIVTWDGVLGFGNGWMLPVGPLRERPSPYAVDGRVRVALIKQLLPAPFETVAARPPQGERLNLANGFYVEPVGICSVREPDIFIPLSFFQGKRVMALAGVANPEGFARTLRNYGVEFELWAGFPDHYAYVENDFAGYGVDVIIMTEKDAVRCMRMRRKDLYFLRVRAVVPEQVLADLVGRLRYVG